MVIDDVKSREFRIGLATDWVVIGHRECHVELHTAGCGVPKHPAGDHLVETSGMPASKAALAWWDLLMKGEHEWEE